MRRYKTTVLTFADQAAKYLEQSVNRKQKPIRPSTLKKYSEVIRKHLNPEIGRLPLESVGNKAVKALGDKLVQRGLSPATIQVISIVIKQIRASAVNEDGDPLFPYNWNTEFMDLPIVDTTAQKHPVISSQKLQELLSLPSEYNQALYAILAGTGLRIAEALALRLDPDRGTGTIWIPSESKIVVREQRIGDTSGPVKTKAGVREIDLHPDLNLFLGKVFKQWFLDQATWADPNCLMFPLSETFYRNVLNRDFKGGFHAFRRFRETHLERMNCPRMLMKFWTGHAASDITERYIKIGSEIETRKSEVIRVGLGFTLPE